MEHGSIVPITSFVVKDLVLEVAFDSNTMATKRFRAPDASLHNALAEANLAVIPAGAKPPSLTPIFGYTFCTAPCSGRGFCIGEPGCFTDTSTTPGYDAAFAEFIKAFPISDSSKAGIGQITPYQKQTKVGLPIYLSIWTYLPAAPCLPLPCASA